LAAASKGAAAFLYARFERPSRLVRASSRPLVQAGGSLAGKLSIDASSLMSDASRSLSDSRFVAGVPTATS
jgi:hypothetical protein